MIESVFPLLGSIDGMAGPAAALIGGTLLGLVFGVLPGISGRTGLILVAPFTLGVDPLVGAVFLVALHAVVHTSGSIPAILVGIPTSAAEAATVIDGHALTRRRRPGLAVGASLVASAAGGVLGAAALVVLMLTLRPVIGMLGQPEILAIALLGLATIAAISEGRVIEGLGAASLGMLLSCVGVDAMTGTPRFTMDLLDLWDGLEIPALLTGLFVFPELMAKPHTATPGDIAASRVAGRQMRLGVCAVIRDAWLVLRASLIGIGVGAIPGMGASIAVWLAYGHAAQTARSRVAFGRGAIAGVIAPEAANNSKEGGALAPTLFLGIPGSSGMAIMIAAFVGMGLQPGPQFIESRADITLAIAATIALANVLAVPLCMVALPALAALTVRTRRIVTPLAIVAATGATLHAAPSLATLVQLAVFGALGCALRAAHWPRAPLVLGFVLGPVVEGALLKTVAIYGATSLGRPIVLAALLAIALSLAAGWRRRRPAPAAPALLTGVLAMPAIGALVAGARFPAMAGLVPLASASVVLVAAVASRLAATGSEPADRADQTNAATCAAALAAMLALGGGIGIPLACGMFVTAWTRRSQRLDTGHAAATGVLAAASLLLFFQAADGPQSLSLGWFATGTP